MEEFRLWKELLEYARWSPSPHNTQPWKVKIVSDTEAELYYDPSRLLPDEDTDGMFMTIGFGIFIEMLSVAAAADGYSVQVQYDGLRLDKEKTEPSFFARLTLQKGNPPQIFDRQLILQRRTSRLSYDGKEIPEDVMRALQAIAAQYGHVLTLSADPGLVDWVVKLNKDTMFYDMNDEKTRNEVGHWIRYSPNDAARSKDGLWAYCMNVASSVMRIFFTARWIINLPGVYQLTGKIYLRTMKGTRTIAWLQGPVHTPEEWLKSGRMLAELWLTMTRYGIGLHPFGSIITNKTSHARLREKFKADESTDALWLIMRLGYSEIPPRSYRLDLNDILI